MTIAMSEMHGPGIKLETKTKRGTVSSELKTIIRVGPVKEIDHTGYKIY